MAINLINFVRSWVQSNLNDQLYIIYHFYRLNASFSVHFSKILLKNKAIIDEILLKDKDIAAML